MAAGAERMSRACVSWLTSVKISGKGEPTTYVSCLGFVGSLDSKGRSINGLLVQQLQAAVNVNIARKLCSEFHIQCIPLPLASLQRVFLPHELQGAPSNHLGQHQDLEEGPLSHMQVAVTLTEHLE